jgi:multidrug resistance protein
MKMRDTKRSPILLMALTVLIDFTGFGIIIPLLPFWAQRLGANPVQIGLLFTAYSLAQFLFLPVLGNLSDRFGRRPVILWSLVIEAISTALTAMVGSFALLLVVRFLGGLGAANIGSAQAVISDTTTPAERAKGMGMIGAAIGLGFVLGPALGGGLSTLGLAVPFWVAAAVALVNAVLVFFLLPETRAPRAQNVARFDASTLLPFAGVARVLRQPSVMRLLVVNLLYTLAFTAMEAMFPLFSQKVFGWNATQNAYLFVYVGVVMVIVQGGLVGRLTKRVGAQPLLLLGLALLGAGLLLLPLGTTLPVLLIAIGGLSAGSGVVSSMSSTLASLATSSDEQGQTLSTLQSVGGLGRIIGPVAAGWVFAFGGAGTPFIVGGLLIVLAIFVTAPAIQLKQEAPSAGLATAERA